MTAETTDEAAIRAIPQRMADAWNTGDGVAFAAPFAEDADFIAFEGTHLKGREEITSFHVHAFDKLVKGSHLECKVKFVRFLNPELALMHSHADITLPGQTKPSPSRDSMELFVVAKRDGSWQAVGMMNGRRLTMEWQLLLDDFVALPDGAQREAAGVVASLGRRASSSTRRVNGRRHRISPRFRAAAVISMAGGRRTGRNVTATWLFSRQHVASGFQQGDRIVIGCNFQTSSEHSTSLRRVRYQRCACGHFQVLLNADLLMDRPPEVCSPHKTRC
jgi:uncharacterized protein (TIGR02246 family)